MDPAGTQFVLVTHSRIRNQGIAKIDALDEHFPGFTVPLYSQSFRKKKTYSNVLPHP